MIQWVHKTWIWFWRTVMVLMAVIVLVGGGIFGLLQLKPTQQYIANRLESEFNDQFKGTLHIDQLGGMPPFYFRFAGVRIQAPSEGTNPQANITIGDPVVSMDTVAINVNLSGLLRRNLVVDRLNVTAPQINLLPHDSSGYTLQRAFETRYDAEKSEASNLFGRLKVVAPYLNVTGGRIHVDRWPDNQSQFRDLPEPFTADSLDLSLYVEITEEQDFVDIEHLDVKLPDVRPSQLSMSGQVFSRDSLLELNGFELRTSQSAIDLTGRINGFNMWKSDYRSQLREAYYTLDIDSTRIYLQEWAGFIEPVPTVDQMIGGEAEIEGDRKHLNISRSRISLGESEISAKGYLESVLSSTGFRYNLSFDTLSVRRDDLAGLFTDNKMVHQTTWNLLEGRGNLEGSLDTVNTNLQLISATGGVEGWFRGSLQAPYRYQTYVAWDSLNLSPWLPGENISDSDLNGELRGKGIGQRWSDAVWNFNGTLFESSVNAIPLQQLDFEVNFIDGFIEPAFTLRNEGGEVIRGEGWIDMTSKPAKLQYGGSATNLNLQHYADTTMLPSTKLDLEYDVELTGDSLSTLYGHTSLDIARSIVDGDTVDAHSFYADINEPSPGRRLLRVTSNLFDLEVSGRIDPKPMLAMYDYWQPYLRQMFTNRILLDSTDVRKKSGNQPATNLQPVDLSANLQLKNVGLLNQYFESLPLLYSASNIDAQLKAGRSKLLIRSSLADPRLRVGDMTFIEPRIQFTGNFTHGRPLDQFGSLNLEAAFGSLSYGAYQFENYKAGVQVENDSISYNHVVEQSKSDAQFSLNANAKVMQDEVEARISTFDIGNQQYTWSSVGTPRISYQRSGAIMLDQFEFRNRDELLSIEGTYSSSLKDSVRYNFENIQLYRLSQMIGGRMSFGGTLNGQFYTRALASQPSIEGSIDINQFTINDRLIGDVDFNSEYQSQQKLFDTRIAIKTDTVKYADYLRQNDGIGQDIVLNGYLQPPEMGGSKDHLYKFNVDFREIDMWIVREIVPDIFDDVEGRARGEGWITGSLSDYDFHAEFNVDDVYANAKFLNTNYWLNGKVEFDKTEGLVFHEVQLSDRHGGSGEVVGRIDMNNFDPVKYFDITLTMNRLQFLNNRLDQDVPFFGEMYGSGQIHLGGNNQNPYLHTTQPVVVSETSQLSIPLMEETELNEESSFIRFVDRLNGEKKAVKVAGNNLEVNNEEEDPADKTFTELFRLDLQFQAPRNTTVKLIFDPVTGDILTAQGTGQLNIRLEDGEVQMFGSYNINNGSYQFVSGDIFTRNFSLESGGQLTWQGDPDNAELDVTAVYSARPTVSSLMGNRSSSENVDQRRIQNMPVDLVLHITGTLSAINNEFYFRLPNTMEISQNVAIANRINQLNRDDEQKLLQATSLLLTGEFIPVTAGGMGGDQPYFGDNLSGSSVVLNPLLSNQVFSPLLSNQINSLLNSDISSLDVDINLNAYNQVDLGIALRLYNNRLVLRREGQVTGPQSNLGSLGATYRINRSLSVKAFHRQDLTLSNLTNTQTQVEYLNGAGIEARVQFNSWKALTRQFFEKIKGIFTKNSEGRADHQKDTDAEGVAGVEDDS